MPNQEQFMSIVRWLLTFAGTALGFSSAPWWVNVSGLVLTVAPFIWGLLTHTQASTAVAAAAIPGVQVAVSRDAPDSLQRLARDPSVPDVVPVSTLKP